MNTDQGSQFTSFDWTDRLTPAKTKISRSAIASTRLPATDGGVGRWITFYNHQRPHAIRREFGPPDQFPILLKHGGQPPAVDSAPCRPLQSGR